MLACLLATSGVHNKSKLFEISLKLAKVQVLQQRDTFLESLALSASICVVIKKSHGDHMMIKLKGRHGCDHHVTS